MKANSGFAMVFIARTLADGTDALADLHALAGGEIGTYRFEAGFQAWPVFQGDHTSIHNLADKRHFCVRRRENRLPRIDQVIHPAMPGGVVASWLTIVIDQGGGVNRCSPRSAGVRFVGVGENEHHDEQH